MSLWLVRHYKLAGVANCGAILLKSTFLPLLLAWSSLKCTCDKQLIAPPKHSYKGNTNCDYVSWVCSRTRHICTWKTDAKAAVNPSHCVFPLWPHSIYTTSIHTLCRRIYLLCSGVQIPLSHTMLLLLQALTDQCDATVCSQILEIVLYFRANPGAPGTLTVWEREREWCTCDAGQVSVLKWWSCSDATCTSVCWNTTEREGQVYC